MISTTLTSTIALFTLFSLSVSAHPPEFIGHGVHKRHHQALSERFGLLEELGLVPPLQERDGVNPSSQEKKKKRLSSSSSVDKAKRDESALYTLFGCVPELTSSGQALLTHQAAWNQTDMQSCIQSCYAGSAVPYLFAGIIRGSECWCDGADAASYTAILSNASTIDQSNCKDTCAEGTEQWCGGATSYEVYSLPITALPTTSADTSATVTSSSSASVTPTPSSPSIPTTVTTPDNVVYNYLGCYADTADPITSVLRGPSTTNSTTTPSTCVDYCWSNGYPYAGVEGTQCSCGGTLFANPSSTIDGCTTPCSADSTQACGTPSQIAVYSISDPSLISAPAPVPLSSSHGWESRGCYIDSEDLRTMPFTQTVDATNLSVEVCTGACKAAGYRYAGLEYGAECYCAVMMPSITLKADAHDCDIVCPGGTGSCGGLLRLDVYAA